MSRKRRKKLNPDFARIIRDLRAAGWNQADIAAWVETTQSNISAISRGREPRYKLGAKIIALHNQECRKRREVTV
jgi:transcriptional regulator